MATTSIRIIAVVTSPPTGRPIAGFQQTNFLPTAAIGVLRCRPRRAFSAARWLPSFDGIETGVRHTMGRL